MKQNPFIRLLSLVLVLALLIQIVPPSVFALEETTASTAVDVPVGQPSYEVLWEETSLRTEDTKHFRLTDGSFIAVNYGMAVHYQDEDGTWQDIDNTPWPRQAVHDLRQLRQRHLHRTG